MKKIFTAILIIISMLLVFSTNNFCLSQPPTSVTGIINTNTIWTKTSSPYSLAGNVLVSNGISVTIEPGVTVNLNGYYIMVNGTLQAKGNGNDKIKINNGEINFTPHSNPWNQQTGDGCQIENAIITFTNITSDITTVKINENTIQGQLNVSPTTIISNNTINANINGGEITSNTITGDVDSNLILNNTITGQIHGTGDVKNNTINGGINADGNGLISNNKITNGLLNQGEVTGSGIYAGSNYVYGGGYPQIQNNIITNCKVGIEIRVLIRDWFSTNIPNIQHNLIANNTVGISYTISAQNPYGNRPPTTIENNTITQNDIGIKTRYYIEQLQIQYNNIKDNKNYNFQLEETANNINATNNYWGTSDPQTISQTIYDFKNDFNLGTVNFTPFLTTENPQATPTEQTHTTPTTTPTTPPPTQTTNPTKSPKPTQPQTTIPKPTNNPTTPSPTIPELQTTSLLLLILATTLAVTLKKKKQL